MKEEKAMTNLVLDRYPMTETHSHSATLHHLDTIQATQDIDFTNLLADFEDYLDVKPATIRNYTKAINIFLGYLYDSGISRPQRNDVINFREQLKAEGKKASTIQNYIIGVRQFFKYLEGKRYYPNIAKDVKGVKVSKEHKKDYLTAEQVGDVISKIDRDTKAGKRNYAIFTLMVTSGLRTIEVSRANIEDMRTVGGSTVLYVQGKGRDDKAEYVKVAGVVERAIREYLGTRSNTEADAPLFTSTSNNSTGKALTTRSISGIVKQALRNANLDSDRLTAHSLRHTTATLNLLAGGSLEETQQTLRHQNIGTTMIYNHALERASNNSEERVAGAIFD